MLPTTTTRDLLTDITTIQHNEKDIICFLYSVVSKYMTYYPTTIRKDFLIRVFALIFYTGCLICHLQQIKKALNINSS